MDKDDIEEILEVVPEELFNEDLLEPEQECRAEAARRKEAIAEGKEEPPREFTMKSLAEVFADLNTLLKSLKLWTPMMKDFH